LRVIVIRHAQTVWNASGRAQGQADPELSETGRRQCDQVAGRLASVTIESLWSSDLTRAHETAMAVAERHPGLAVGLDSDLREISLGQWEGADRNTLQRDWPDLYAGWLSRPSWDLVPDGEGSAAFKARVMRCFGRIVAAASDDQTVAVVTHIGVIRTLLATVVGADAGDLRWPWAIDNTGLTTLQGPPDVEAWNTPALEVLAVNDTVHLGPPSQAAART
jgi:broad specificity phosphatase PhoE